MRRAAAGLTALALVSVLCPTVAAAPVELRYRGQIGEVREYRLSLQAQGEQTILGESRPVRIEAELELREEVVATGPAESFWLRTRAKALRIKDPTGTFGAGQGGGIPEVLLRVSPAGAVLESEPVADRHVGPLQRAFASFIAGPTLVILPMEPVRVGSRWNWEEDQARQNGRLTSIRGHRLGPVAGVEMVGRAPVSLQERSEALGVETRLSGEQTQSSELELLLDRGVVLRHKGDLKLTTNGEVKLALGGGVRRFPVRSAIKVEFDLRLIRLAGQPVGATPTESRSTK